MNMTQAQINKWANDAGLKFTWDNANAYVENRQDTIEGCLMRFAEHVAMNQQKIDLEKETERLNILMKRMDDIQNL